MNKKSQNKGWTTVITSKKRWFNLNLKEVFSYKDLIALNVEREFKVKYKQTILGPLWFILQPLLLTLVHTLIFGNLARLAPGIVPTFLFYMSANILWIFFSGVLSSTSTTFLSYSRLFGKIYFPRLTIPISTLISSLIKFVIEFAVFMVAMLIYYLSGATFSVNWVAFLTPVFLLQLGLLAMGIGIIVSAVTVKYRDLQVLVSFSLQLWMFVSPVVYGASSIENQTIKTLIMCNPVSASIELMRYGWLGVGNAPWEYFIISCGVTILLLFFGICIFNRAEKNFMDTI
jgi:lipopolysaccharide transport system permease protein